MSEKSIRLRKLWWKVAQHRERYLISKSQQWVKHGGKFADAVKEEYPRHDLLWSRDGCVLRDENGEPVTEFRYDDPL